MLAHLLLLTTLQGNSNRTNTKVQNCPSTAAVVQCKGLYQPACFACFKPQLNTCHVAHYSLMCRQAWRWCKAVQG